MARLARVVVPGVALHVAQRGNRRQEAFSREADCGSYLALLKEWCDRFGVAVWANRPFSIVSSEHSDGPVRPRKSGRKSKRREK
jgi:hypothetical protein